METKFKQNAQFVLQEVSCGMSLLARETSLLDSQ